MSETLKPCPLCGSEAAPTVSDVGKCEECYKYDDCEWFQEHGACEGCETVDRTTFVVCDFNAGGCGSSGPYRDTEAEAIAAWNARAAVTDHDFAMAVHDGQLWGRCSECGERRGLESMVDERDGLIRDMWRCLSAHVESAINDGGCGHPYSPQTRGCGEGCTVNGEDCSMSLIERRMRRLGIEVGE